MVGSIYSWGAAPSAAGGMGRTNSRFDELSSGTAESDAGLSPSHSHTDTQTDSYVVSPTQSLGTLVISSLMSIMVRFIFYIIPVSVQRMLKGERRCLLSLDRWRQQTRCTTLQRRLCKFHLKGEKHLQAPGVRIYDRCVLPPVLITHSLPQPEHFVCGSVYRGLWDYWQESAAAGGLWSNMQLCVETCI